MFSQGFSFIEETMHRQNLATKMKKSPSKDGMNCNFNKVQADISLIYHEVACKSITRHRSTFCEHSAELTPSTNAPLSWKISSYLMADWALYRLCLYLLSHVKTRDCFVFTLTLHPVSLHKGSELCEQHTYFFLVKMYFVGYYCHSGSYLVTQSKAMTSCIACNDFLKGKKMPFKTKGPVLLLSKQMGVLQRLKKERD